MKVPRSSRYNKMAVKKSEPLVAERELWVENRLGLHARPAMKIMQLAQQFQSEVVLEKDGVQASARNLLAILTLDCPQGSRLVVRAVGPDAAEATLALSRLFAQKFGEP